MDVKTPIGKFIATTFYPVIFSVTFLFLFIGCTESETEVMHSNFDGDVLVGRPTDQGASISVMSFSGNQVYVEYGSASGSYSDQTEPLEIPADEVHVFELEDLESNTEYYYRLRFRTEDSQDFAAGSEYSFDTQKPLGSSFNFAVEADPHLGARTRFQKWCGDRCLRESADDKVFAVTVENMLRADPDFVVDLGDTFMTAQNFQNGLFEVQNREGGATITEAEVLDDVLYLRELFAPLGSSVPVMLVQGNHEAEDGARLDGTPDNLAVWAVNARKNYFPSPTDNGFYSGPTTEYDFIGRQDGHYSWEWGNALFVALDPYWEPNATNASWDRSLGREQYDWLKRTLEASDATFKFVFLHHLIGGCDNAYGGSRGGSLCSDYFEWGGRTPFDYEERWLNYTQIDGLATDPDAGFPEIRRVDSSTEAYDFDEHRPGWEAPIQDLLLENNVQIVFHGHDHHYAMEVHENGIIYQEVPQPSRAGGESPEHLVIQGAAWKNYDTERGVIMENAGFLNVTVTPDKVTVDYVKNIENCTEEPCSEIAHSYSVDAG
jgi:hypothetical protein